MLFWLIGGMQLFINIVLENYLTIFRKQNAQGELVTKGRELKSLEEDLEREASHLSVAGQRLQIAEQERRDPTKYFWLALPFAGPFILGAQLASENRTVNGLVAEKNQLERIRNDLVEKCDRARRTIEEANIAIAEANEKNKMVS